MDFLIAAASVAISIVTPLGIAGGLALVGSYLLASGDCRRGMWA